MPNFMGMANQNTSSPPLTTRFRSFFTAFNPGDTSWVVPATGYYTFTQRGAGGGANGSTGGGAGGASQTTVLLFSGQTVTFSIGRGAAGTTGETTTLTLPSGRVITTAGGVNGTGGGTGGSAAGGDTNVAGGAGSVGGAGGIAPAIGQFSAISSAIANFTYGPSAGASTNGGGTTSLPGAGILFLQAGKV